MALRQLGVWVEGAGGAATESGQCRAAGRLRGKADRLGAEMPPKPHCLGSRGQVLCHSYACAESGSPGGVQGAVHHPTTPCRGRMTVSLQPPICAHRTLPSGILISMLLRRRFPTLAEGLTPSLCAQLWCTAQQVWCVPTPSQPVEVRHIGASSPWLPKEARVWMHHS